MLSTPFLPAVTVGGAVMPPPPHLPTVIGATAAVGTPAVESRGVVGGACTYCGVSNPYAPEWFFCSAECELAHTTAMYGGAYQPMNGRGVSVGSTTASDASTVGTLTPPPQFLSHPQHSRGSGTFSSSCGGADGLSSVSSAKSLDGASDGGVIATMIAASGLPASNCAGYCAGCAKPCGAQVFCSKRCEWSATTRCPQCGRPRDPAHSFCSLLCASQAAQANWCCSCGVRQTTPGTTHCSSHSCAQAAAVHSGALLPRRKVVLNNQRRVHAYLPHEDRVHHNLNNIVVGALNLCEPGVAHHVAAVIKITPDTLRRKQFLNYRGAVEQQISAAARVAAATGGSTAKYGHGGEGNEQKRYFPVAVECDLAARGGSANGVALCGSPSCEACNVLANGFSLEHSMCASHYCTTSAQCALPWARASEITGLRAIVAARVVVGNPVVLADSTMIALPDDPTVTHCTIVSNGDPQQDGTYLFRDDAIDPQYLVLFK